jgi:hypothetical protein
MTRDYIAERMRTLREREILASVPRHASSEPVPLRKQRL